MGSVHKGAEGWFQCVYTFIVLRPEKKPFAHELVTGRINVVHALNRTLICRMDAFNACAEWPHAVEH